MNASPVVLGIDGNSIAHRAFHAYENRPGNTNDPYDRPLSATYGFLALLAGIADKVRSRCGRLDAVIVGFDDPHSSQRRDRYPDYKAHRPAKDPSLVTQLETIPDIVRRLGVTVITPTGLEADDVIASVAATAEQHGHRVVLATSDRDAFSQISPTTTVLRLASGLDQAVWLDPDTLHDTYGIWPAAYPLYAAMRGDSSDNLPGIAGVGEKRAAALVAAYTTVDDMLADPD
ncbi:MAG: hypothetical protein L7U56_03975, partial [Acidimicrobiales bacterium]|nr:hypothetical protein [Acidimicrobiales bacterium]